MKAITLTITFAGALAMTAVLTVVHAASNETKPTASPSQVERGGYIVKNVGLCADCHTPHKETGELDLSRWLMGAPIPFQPTGPMPWSPVAPTIAGLPSMTEQQAHIFLQTGKRPDGSLARPPMPPFRMDNADAAAVTAYLKSLAR